MTFQGWIWSRGPRTVPGEKFPAFSRDIRGEDVVGYEEELLLVVKPAGLGSGYLGERGGHFQSSVINCQYSVVVRDCSTGREWKCIRI